MNNIRKNDYCKPNYLLIDIKSGTADKQCLIKE